MQSLSTSASCIAWAAYRALLTMLKWDRATALGAPTVPLVNWMLMASSGSSAAASTGKRRLNAVLPRRTKSEKRSALAGTSPSPRTITCLRWGRRRDSSTRRSPGWSNSGANSRNKPKPRCDWTDRATITTRQRTLFSANSSSRSPQAGLMLTSTAPMRAAPNCTSSHSRRFGEQMPTRLPRRIPSANNDAATSSDRR